jgi:exonuclease VII small subunit
MAKGEFNYDKALQRIKDIAEKLESDVSIEELEKMIKEAKELILKCKEKLRTLDTELS